MKSKLLFTAMMLVGLTSATATTAGDAVLNGEDLKTNRYSFTQPISFVERGIEFLIFPDGSFDFNTEVFTTITDNDDYYYKRNRRSTNRTYGAPGVNQNLTDRGVIIRHDRSGKVRRIGNVFINYDRHGRIKRAGSVYISYKRNGTLRQVGGLRVNYNGRGQIVHTSGVVNQYNSTLIYGMDYSNGNHNTIGFHEIENYDEDYYYYKKNGKIKKSKKRK